MSVFSVQLCGTISITKNEQPVRIRRRKAVALLAYLCLADGPQHRDHLSTLLWPESDSTSARASLRTTLSELNQVFEDTLKTDRDHVQLAVERGVEVDVHQLLHLDADTDVDPFQQVPCGQVFMQGFSLDDSHQFDNWQSLMTRQIENAYERVMTRIIQAASEKGNNDRAISLAQQWAQHQPLNDQAHAMLIHTYLDQGDSRLAERHLEHVVRAFEDHELPLSARIKALASKLESSTKTTGIWLLPPSPSMMVGRSTHMDHLAQQLSQMSTGRYVIYGWPGVGKSTFMARLAHLPDVQAQFSDGVLWTSLGQDPDLRSKLNVWASFLGIAHDPDTTDLEKLSLQIRVALHAKRMLLMIDDVWDQHDALPFLLQSEGIVVLLSTRFDELALALSDAPTQVYRLPVLSQDDSLRILQTLCPQVVEQYPQQTRQLAIDLEGLPLSLQVAGRLLHAESRFEWGIGNLIAELREGTRLLNEQAPLDRADSATGMTPTVSVLLRRSTDLLDEDMRLRFALLGLFAEKPATFDLAAISAVWDDPSPQNSVRHLVNRGLLEPIGDRRFQMHALLSVHARNLMAGA